MPTAIISKAEENILKLHSSHRIVIMSAQRNKHLRSLIKNSVCDITKAHSAANIYFQH